MAAPTSGDLVGLVKMGMDPHAQNVWSHGSYEPPAVDLKVNTPGELPRRIRAIAAKLDSPHADKVYVAKEYTKADLRRDLLAMIPGN